MKVGMHLGALAAVANERPAGYVEALAKAGSVRDGVLYMEEEAFRAIQARFKVRRDSWPMGLGDWLWAILHPLAVRADRALGTKLAGCKGCSSRRVWFNRLGNRVSEGLKRAASLPRKVLQTAVKI